LYIFNPDNDLALASDVANFTTPPHAAQIAHDLCTLPYFIAGAGDYVLVHTELQKQWIADIDQRYQRGITGVCADEIPDLQIERVCPWGWSRSIRQRLLRLGVDGNLLLSDEALAQIRYAASRERTIDIMKELQHFESDRGGVWCECPTRCDDFFQVKSFIESHRGTVLKAPWSSSGKGIYIPNSPNERPMEQWCRGIIRRQGFIIAEPLYEKVLDFAMEFGVCRGRGTSFAGYSVFFNDSHNSFDYGVVAENLELETIICETACVSADRLAQLSASLCKIIDSLVGNVYDGYVGVDMMVCVCSDGRRFINPCVEVNLRCTMGVLANRIALLGCVPDRSVSCVPSDVRKKFMVRYYQTKDEYMVAAENAVATGGIILNAIDENTHFLASVE
ncbi:MAG: hypothetical protein K2J74_06095, partial [Muribaculaceae bacterium]|nr:hypothetical protein [Muribaculaceae bacterium]